MLSMKPGDQEVWEKRGIREENGDEDFIHNKFETDPKREGKPRIEET